MLFSVNFYITREPDDVVNKNLYRYIICMNIKMEENRLTCIVAAGPALIPDIRKSSGSLSYGGSSYQCPS